MTTDLDQSGVIRRIEELQEEINELRRQHAPNLQHEAPPEGPFHVLVCRVGDERVAFLHSSVDEVVLTAKLIPLPDAPPWVPGMLNLRGTMIPVIDVLARFSRRESAPALSDLIVIGRAHRQQVGLIVQEVIGSYPCRPDLLEQPHQDMVSSPFLLGILHIESVPTLLLGTSSFGVACHLPEVST